MARSETVTLSDGLEALPTLLDRLESFGEAAGLPSGRLKHLALSLDEVVTNVLTYGADPSGRAPEVTVHLRHGDGSIEVEVVDATPAFDPLEAGPPDLESDLEDRPVGGLGIFLARQLTDEHSYRREAGCNRLTLRMLLA